MSGSSEPKKPEPNGMVAYVLVTHGHLGSDYMDTVEISGVYLNIKDAVSALEKQRLNLELLNLADGWTIARDFEARDNYPYRNKIGELYNNDAGGPGFIGWGYAWPQPDGSTCTNRVYLEKTNIWNSSSGIGDRSGMGSDEFRVLQAESDIEYVDGQYLRKHSRDLVFEYSDEYSDSEEGRLKDESRLGFGLNGNHGSGAPE
jgi:hypothetical protein